MADNAGTFAGCKLSTDTCYQLMQVLSNIPNPLPVNKLHITLLFSHKYLPNYVASNDIYPIIAKPITFDIWLNADKTKNCLVLKLDSPELVKRHLKLMKDHNATHDYPNYIPHVTLSYDVANLDLSKLDMSILPMFLTVISEYQENLDVDWANKK